MFRGVGRRLAILNALVVIAVIALTGAATYVLLRASLDDEVDNGLKARVEQVEAQLGDQVPAPAVGAGGQQGRDEHDDREALEEILESGDTIVLVVDRSGAVTYNPRDVPVGGPIPVDEGVARALGDDKDRRTVALDGLGRVRVLTVPLEVDHQVVGAIQAVRSLHEHEAELATVQWMTLAGVGLGALVAVPAGLLLARRAMRPIDAAFARQREFVADASHELRTPLTLIRASAEFAQQDPDAPVAAVQEELSGILQEVDRTDRLVGDLLTLARADAGQLALRRARVDLGAVVAGAAASMGPLARAGSVSLVVEPGGACAAVVDAARIEQVVRIILDNALKHTPPGGRVTVGVGCDGREVVIAVRDTGVGIAPREVSRVFDRFYRVDTARTRAAGGTGLGLSIARSLVEAHGGRIALTSAPGAGTTVTVTLPAEPRGAPTPRAVPQPEDGRR